MKIYYIFLEKQYTTFNQVTHFEKPTELKKLKKSSLT